jgi:hypothetical protein
MKIRRGMEVPVAPVILLPQYPIPYLLFAFLLIILIVLAFVIESVSNIGDIKNNWSEYRCKPYMMPLSFLYGYNINDNFQYCLQQIIQSNTKGVTGPFTQGMSGFTDVLMNLMQSANSFRLTLATMVGGIIKIVSEFKTRMTALMGRVKLTASRMKSLMYRIYGTMFSVMYMGISAQTGIANFGDTFIFKFIDTFCFTPEERMILDSGYAINISNLVPGNILQGGHTVEIIYRFLADGQEMVDLDNIVVSSNHFVKYKNKWIMAKNHPMAIPVGPWAGGIERPLICLTTSDHRIPIQNHIFADYDETEAANADTQYLVDISLNGKSTTPRPPINVSYDVGVPYTTLVNTLKGYTFIQAIKLGDKITERDTVVGIQETYLSEFCVLPNGQYIAKGSLLWNPQTSQWSRAYTMYPEINTSSIKTISLFVSPGAKYQIYGDHILRDSMEIYSPDTKKLYAEYLLDKTLVE